MRAFKGFKRQDDGTLWCLDFKYDVGKTYKHNSKIELCESGFHACHELHKTWRFYPNNGYNVFYEVECGGKIIESEEGDGKFVCSEITLVKEIDLTDVEKFEEAWDFCEGYAVIRKDGKGNHINTEGKLLSGQWYDWVGDFSEGFSAAKFNDKWNFINTESKLLSDKWYDSASSFHGGFAAVKLNGKYNFIDTEGNLLSEQWFDDTYSFYEGFATVKLDGKWHKIDTEGKIVG